MVPTTPLERQLKPRWRTRCGLPVDLQRLRSDLHWCNQAQRAHALRDMLRTSGTDASTCRPPRTTRSSTNTAFHSRLFRSSTTSPVLPGGEWKRRCTSGQKRTRWTKTKDQNYTRSGLVLFEFSVIEIDFTRISRTQNHHLSYSGFSIGIFLFLCFSRHFMHRSHARYTSLDTKNTDIDTERDVPTTPTHHTFQIVLERVPVDKQRLAFSFSVAYLKMAGATRPKRRALENWLLVWWEKGIRGVNCSSRPCGSRVTML